MKRLGRIWGVNMWRNKMGLAIGLLLLCSVGSWAQSTGAIGGQISDESGAVIPRATRGKGMGVSIADVNNDGKPHIFNVPAAGS